MFLVNRIDKKILKDQILKDKEKRKTLSFYRYFPLDDLSTIRNNFYEKLISLQVLGRIYLAKEGINAQISVPENNFLAFEKVINTFPFGEKISFRFALEERYYSFYKLKIKIREKIVADGISENLDFSLKGQSLSAKEFNKHFHSPNTLVIDVRNHYETEVGHFENALTIDSDTFRELLPELLTTLKKIENSKEKKLILYCTGGIRCEKASAFLAQAGFKDVNQLKGGIINYAHEVKKANLPNYFKGKNFVFDDRLGERVSEEVIARCHQCNAPADTHTNCANDDCHLLFIQCAKCKAKMDNCCSTRCQEIIKLPLEEQKKRRKRPPQKDNLAVYKSRLRPRLQPFSQEKNLKSY